MSSDTRSPASGTLQVGDTVHLLVQDVDIPRRRLSLALEKLDNAHQAGAASASLSASAGQKRIVEPLVVAISSSGGSKRPKQ
jgi:hypothetical protein